MPLKFPEHSGPAPRFTVVAAAAALVCAFLMVLWVRSVSGNDVLRLPKQRGDHWLVTSAFGTFNVQWEAAQAGEIKPGWVFMQSPLPRDWPNDWRWIYFHPYRSRAQCYRLLPPAPVYGLSVPHWFLIGLAGVLPAIWWRRFRRSRLSQWRAGHGLCRRCGYDLRATPDGKGPLQACCPECGLEVTRGVTYSRPAGPAGRLPGSVSAVN